MEQAKILLRELQRESVSTRKLLERIPADQLVWQPHAKSMHLGRLAGHIAEIPALFITEALRTEERDFAKIKYAAFRPGNPGELLAFFDDNIHQAEKALQEITEDNLQVKWSLRMGDHLIMSLPRAAVVRTLALNHVIHHRGQLSVYLRLLDIPVPGMYGPSADEQI